MVTVEQALADLKSFDVTKNTENESLLDSISKSYIQNQTIEKSALGNRGILGNLADRTAWGFADKDGQYKILIKNQGYNPADIITLANGELGVRTQQGIKPVDPKGFQLGDMVGDIAESIGKGITTTGGILGAAGGSFASPVAGTIAGAGAGSAAGEYARQYIGNLLGVRDNLDAGEIALEGALGAAGAGIGIGIGKVASKFAKQPVTQNLDDIFKTKTVSDSLKTLSKDQIDELSDMPVKQLKNLIGQTDPSLATKTARIEDFYGIDDDVAAHLIKSAKAGRNIDTSITAGKASDAEIAKRVLEIRESSNKLKSYLGSKYAEMTKGVNKSQVIDNGEIKTLVGDLLDDTPELARIVQKSGLNKKKITVGDLLNAKQKINDTAIMKKHWLAASQGKPEFTSEAGINLERLDGIIRAKLNTVDDIAKANSMFGESIDSIKKVQALMTDARGERNLLKMRDPTGAWLRVGEPLKEFEAVILKHGNNAGVKPVYDKIMDNIVSRQFGTAQTKLVTSSPIVRAAKGIPIVQGVVDNLSTPWALAKSIKASANASKITVQLAAKLKAMPPAKALIELNKLVGKEASSAIAGQLGIKIGGKSLNQILGTGEQ